MASSTSGASSASVDRGRADRVGLPPTPPAWCRRARRRAGVGQHQPTNPRRVCQHRVQGVHAPERQTDQVDHLDPLVVQQFDEAPGDRRKTQRLEASGRTVSRHVPRQGRPSDIGHRPKLGIPGLSAATQPVQKHDRHVVGTLGSPAPEHRLAPGQRPGLTIDPRFRAHIVDPTTGAPPAASSAGAYRWCRPVLYYRVSNRLTAEHGNGRTIDEGTGAHARARWAGRGDRAPVGRAGIRPDLPCRHRRS